MVRKGLFTMLKKCVAQTKEEQIFENETSRGSAEGERSSMDEVKFKSFDDLPLTLTVMEVAEALRISRAGAYDLVRTERFPALKIGSRIVIPKEKFIEWMNENTGKWNRN